MAYGDTVNLSRKSVLAFGKHYEHHSCKGCDVSAFMSTAQPPGVPEICKKSLSACPCTGGMELFILGKNFLKDTRVVFQHGDAMLETPWEESMQPDKEFLQQVCGN